MKKSGSALFQYNGCLYRNPVLYDFVVNTPEGELEFYQDHANRLGDDILELACGTGRVSLHLAKTNPIWHCSGLDISEEMLAYARNKTACESVDVDFHHADMSSFDLKKKFNLIFVALSSILYLHRDEQILNCFQSVRRHLKPRGEFVFSIFNPSQKILDLSPQQRYVIKRFINPENDREVLVEQGSDYSPIHKVNYATHYYSYSDQKDFFYHPVHLRILFPHELTALLEYCGFEQLAVYGNYQGDTFNHDSPYQLVVCRPMRE